jgi:hypothetical protein
MEYSRGGSIIHNREDGTEISVTPARSLERPINTPEQDKLERGGFIAHLCRAVIERNTKKAPAPLSALPGHGAVANRRS